MKPSIVHVSRRGVASAFVTALWLALASTASADETPLGTWELRYRLRNREVTGRLTIQQSGGALVGRWTSRGGRSDGNSISRIKFDKGKLTFVRKVRLGRRDVQMTFEGTVSGSRLTGTFAHPRRRIQVTGTRLAAARPIVRGRPRAPKPTPTHADVKYGPHERNVLDFWRAKSNGPAPLVVYIHGGGFRGGSKGSLNTRTLRELLGAGISVAAIHYRLVPKDPLPAAHHDSRRALQFLRSKAKEWNVDRAKVGAFGGSAGAQLCMYLAFHDDMAVPDSAHPIARESTRLHSVATSGGQTTMDFAWWKRMIPGYDSSHRDPRELYGDLPEEKRAALVEEISALSLISSDDPPIFMSYGMKPDDPVPTDPGRARGWKVHHVMFGVKLKEAMERLGIEADLKYPGATTTYPSNAKFFIARLRGTRKPEEKAAK